MIQKIDKKAVQDAVQMAYDRCKNETGGKNADYIPYLADVPSNLFGIAACLPDGDVVAVGDTDYKFGIESVSKVPTAILAMNQYGARRCSARSAPTPRDSPSTRSWPSCSKTTTPRRRW